MAVVRLEGQPRWFRKIAAGVEDHPRLVRELRRAADRPGQTAEVTASECRILAERFPDEQAIIKSAFYVAEVEAADMRALADRRAMMDRVRGSPPS